jgi:hypothetical protein
MGYGPMTGRGAGYCAGYDAPGAMSPWHGRRAWGRGWGGRGGGRGWRHWYYATGLPGWARGGWPLPPFAPYAGAGGTVAGPGGAIGQGPDVTVLREQAKYLEEALANVRKRLEDLEAKPEE